MNEQKPDFSVAAALFPHINPEGLKFGGIATLVAFVVALLASHVWWLGWLVIPVFLLAYGVFLFFRDPERYPPEDEKAILSPADGRIHSCLIGPPRKNAPKSQPQGQNLSGGIRISVS